MPLFKSTGTTPSEQYLARLCQKTFLSLWSYPNVFRDQGQHHGKGDGKELCDLLVVCGNDVVIFSDKSCQFPDTGNLPVDWCRWFKRSVLKSAEQVCGAERWIKQHPDRLFLDRRCTERFPLPLVDPAKARFHRVVVALNVADRCRKELGGSGSVVIAPAVIGEAHIDPRHPQFQPFFVGRVDHERAFVHVLDDVALDVILQELDTVSDFLRYLTAKEDIVAADGLGYAADEPDLLATYLIHTSRPGCHCFPPLPGGDKLAVDQGHWASLESDPQYQAKKLFDRRSYFWDRIIEQFIGHLTNRTFVGAEQPSFRDTERALRAMAAETRFSRRTLVDAFVAVLKNTPKVEIRIRTVVNEASGDTLYVFVSMPGGRMPEEQYREYRRLCLNDYCLVVQSRHHSPRLVGLATESGLGGTRSYDLCYMEDSEWTEEMEVLARRIQTATGIYTHTTQTVQNSVELPELVGASLRPVREAPDAAGRNDPCPCGSGMKFKKCCGRR